ncbi:hypothetical protein [Meridianimaribacter flavus]|uniref:DUF4251 domain-containing protein n=1 Tax=Meridianimaribacter flavus TaxID=571115 RepID=A0ABY2G846_9FLAO|nr:hypothetical protein [Meridianimaribacter flavus]TDY12365.1 hypothetical protein A8975_1129 [Meridianimaribacter flavus]
MKKLSYLIAICCLLSIQAIAQDWQKYKSEDLAFIAYFPETPKRTVQQVETAVGTLDMHMVMCTPQQDDNVVYSTIKSDYPEEQFIDADDKYNTTVLDGAVKGAVSNVNGSLIFDKKITFNGYPGRDVKIEIQGGFIYIRVVLVTNSMYISQVICTPENDNNSKIERFLDGFEIIKVKQ